MRSVVKIADVDIELRAPDGSLADPLEALFSGCPAGDPSGVRVVVDRRIEPIEPPPSPPSAVTTDASYWFVDTGVVARHVSGVCGRRSGDVVEVGGVSAPGDAATALRLALQMPLCDALARHDCEVIHAAAISRDGFGVLVTGLSGAGKSTFAYAAQSAGWTVHTDDLTMVRGVEQPRVWGFPKPLHVPAEVLTTPPAGATAIPDDDRGRWSLAPPAAEPSDGVPLGLVVAVGRSEADAATDVGGDGIPWVKELLFSFPFVRIPDRLKSLFPTAASLARLPAVRYLHDRDPERRVAAVVEFLDGLDAPPTRP